MLRLVVLLFICSFLCPSQCFLDFMGLNLHNRNCLMIHGYFQCNNGECIPLSSRCDVDKDCKDGSDEEDCDNEDYEDYEYEAFHACKKNEYKCKNTKCIPAAKFCDLVRDCEDGSDEYYNCVRDLNCSNKFRCSDQHCILHDWVCDGSKDCSDGSDEWNCNNKTSSVDCKIENSQYLCANQRCIALDAVCNVRDDCGDKSDEGDGCRSSPTICSSAKCDYKCKATPKGTVCICKPGYKLKHDNRTCEDIDECQNYGICDQTCINYPGSYNCSCQEEYSLSFDKKTCKANAGEATMLFSTKTKIMGMYLESKITFEVASHLNRATGVAINGEYTYWSDIKDNKEIIVRKISRNNYEAIVTTGLSKISGIAVDWITDNIYFTDEVFSYIGLCNSDGTNCTVLINKNDITEPTSIALLPTRGKMYWSDQFLSPRIAVAGMDGKNIRTLVSENVSWPISVTIDYPNDRLYWVDSKLKIFESIRLDGTDRRQILHDVINQPFSLAIFENMLYWSDWGLNLIESCNKFSQKDWRILQRLDDKPYGIHIDHSALKPKIDNPCKSNPCSQLCMLNQDKGYTCACTLDKELNADKHTCREKRQHLLIVTKNTFINYYHEILGKPKVTNISEPLFIHCVTSDPSSGQIIMQSGSGNIVRYDPVDNTFENIMHSSINPFFSGIAFDHIGNNLYTFNVRNKSIEVHNVKTLAMTAFYYFDYKDIPSSITLAPEESKMFVAVQRNFFQISYVIATNISIYEMRMDGLGERKLLRSIINEEYINEELSMCYDRDSKTLFTSDGNHGNILSFSKQEWRVLRTGLRNPGSLAVAGDILFWIEHDTTLFWTNLKITSNHKTVAFRISQKPIINILHPAFIVTLRKDAKQEHGCQKNNGNCSHVCLVSSITSFICACPPGMELLSDNRTCVSHHECPKDEFKCSEHILCIKKEKLCDGIIDCPNGEDETINCENKENRCKKDQFMCKNSDCISLKDRCNSHYDCTDQSDEENCEKPKCKSDEFQCRDGTCIPNSKVCDNIFDCFDFSDEQVYTCPTVPTAHTCAPNEFRCNDLYRCIPNHFVCDGERDCTDGEDEAKCNPDTTDCHGNFRCTNGDCISLSLQCNGIDDCQDGSDERHCLNKQNYLVNCTADEYHCLNTAICLPKKLRCNGVNDCPRNDDEHNCLFCFDDEFACNNKKCIPEKWVCDKKDDCDDNSDEKDCGGMIIDVAGGCNEFKCSNGACLAYNFVCDGYPNCEDGSDENGKCQIACTLSNSCKGICYKTPKGAVCGCPHGYRLASDAVSCEDINECEQDVCSQICQNTVGSYECSCYDRYIIRSDKVSCKAVGSAMKFIVATENDIRQVSSNFHLIEEIHSLSDSSVSGFDVHAKLNFVYWSNEKFGTIKKLGIETRKVTTVMVVEHPAALAVDWVTDNVYVIDNSRPNTIKVCDLERPRCATLVTIEDEARAISLIVDPIDKFLFWSQITWQMEKPFSKIYRANMMGVDMKIISSQPGMVIGMTIDYIKSKLYWTNNDKNTIESSNLDGSQYSTYLNLAMHPSSISIYEQSLYWLMGSDGLVKHCQLYGRKLCFVDHHVGKNNYKHFTILHTSRQPFDKNPCMEQDCDYMCVLEEENDATCICSDGKPIKSNSTCTINTNEPRFAIISSSRNTRPISSVYSILVIVLLVGVLLLCIYYYYQRNKLKWKSANDYRCTSIRFQNPSFDRRDEVEVILNSVISDLVPGHHEYANPIDDKLLKSATECSAQKSNQCSKENGVEETEKESALLFAHIK